MIAIFKREFKNYFYSPLGYVFIGVFMALAAAFFVAGPMMNGSADIRGVLSSVDMVCMILIPLLTMGLLSEERNKKTDQLLLSSPVKVSHIVLGKYLAACAVLGVTILLSFLFAVIMSIFGTPIMTEMIGSYIGFALMWMTFIAIGVFVSSLTESQIIAAVISFGVMLAVYILDWFSSAVSNDFIKNILSWISLTKRYNSFQMGVFDITNIIYFASVIFLFLYLCTRSIDKRRYS